MNSYLQLKNISKNFNIDKKIKVLKNLSYDFHKGKVYALMGPSGSGKSTLLNLISLIDRPTLGSIKFNNNKIYKYKSNGHWLDIGFGNGSLLFTAHEYGYIPVGLDLRKKNVDQMKYFEIECYDTDIENFKYKEN